VIAITGKNALVHYPLTAHRRDTVLALLRPFHGGSASLVAEVSLGHDWAPVTRLTFDRDLPGVGRAVVVKTRRVDGAGHGGPAHLRREEAALRLAAPTGVTARLVASDHAAGVVVTTDLEDWPTLESVLLGADADAATPPHAVRIVDFEGAIFGHLGFDLSFLHFPFPTYSAHWATLPDSVVIEADRAYRRELAKGMPGDILERLDQALAVGAAAALAVRVQRLPLLAAPGPDPRTRWRRRAQLVQQIRVFTRLAESAATLPRMADWYTRLADAMSARWPDATTPPPATFPAFRSARHR